MRKNFLILTLLLFSATSIFAQSQLDNGQFEDWDDSSHATGWKSDVGGLIPTADRVTDAHSGTYAAKITTGSFFGQSYPGIMMLGDLDVTTFLPSGGVPFEGRPSSISAQLKYLPANQDSMIMFAYFTKWNPLTEHTDTIGATLFMGGTEMTEYTKMNFPVFYISEEIPDSVNIGFSASDLTMEAGSTLYIDSVAMEYGVQVLPTIALPATARSVSGFTANWLPPLNAEGFSLDVAYDEAFTDFVPGFENVDAGSGFSMNVTVPQQSNPLYYRVRVRYTGNETSFNSNAIEAVLPYPTTAIEATDTTHNSFTARWLPVEAATGYSLDVSEDVNFSTFQSGYNNFLTGNVTEHLVSGLEMETEYFYRIRANYGIQDSESSNTISVITDFFLSNTETKVSNLEVFAHKNTITVRLNKSAGSLIEIFNTGGQRVFVNSAKKSNQIHVEEPGLYIVRITSSEGSLSKKILITN